MLVGLPVVVQALEMFALAHVWYVSIVEAAPLRLEAEDLQHQIPYLIKA